MTFENAVAIHQKYLARRNAPGDARERILSFLQWEEPREDEFAQDVRIVIAARDFDKDVTSTVLWLRERDVDIRCVRLTPYQLADSPLLDIQVVIPLPEAEEYQQSIRVKQREERVQQSSRRRGRFSARLSGRQLDGLTGKHLALTVIRWALIDRGANPEEVEALVGFNRGDLWLHFPQQQLSEEDVKQALEQRKLSTGKTAALDPVRWFYRDHELIYTQAGTYLLSNQWEVQAAKAACEALVARFGAPGDVIEDSGSTAPVVAGESG